MTRLFDNSNLADIGGNDSRGGPGGSVILVLLNWKITAVILAVATLSIATLPRRAGNLTPDEQAVCLSINDGPRGLLPRHEYRKHAFRVRDVLTVGLTPFRLPPPVFCFVARPISRYIAPSRLPTRSAAIRAPPNT